MRGRAACFLISTALLSGVLFVAADSFAQTVRTNQSHDRYAGYRNAPGQRSAPRPAVYWRTYEATQAGYAQPTAPVQPAYATPANPQPAPVYPGASAGYAPVTPASEPVYVQSAPVASLPPTVDMAYAQPYSSHPVSTSAPSAPAKRAASSPGGNSADDWKFAVGVGVAALPKFDGADEYRVVPFPYLDITWKDRVFLNSMQGFGGHIYKDDSMQFSAALGYRMGRDWEDIRKYGATADIDGAIEGSLIGNYFIPVGPGRARVGVELTGDLSGVYEGFTVHWMAGYGMAFSPQFKMSVDASLNYGSDDFMQTYYGISSSMAAAAGIGRYNAGASLYAMSLTTSANYTFNDEWSMFGLVGYRQLLGDAADSPLIDRDGNDQHFYAGSAVVYSF